MNISFNVPHAFGPGSNHDASVDALRIVRSCEAQLNSVKPEDGVSFVRHEINGRLVVWDMGPYFTPEATYGHNAFALKALLDCLVDLNLSYLLKYMGKKKILKLYQSPIYYKRTQVWDTIPALHKRGYGDCKSLTAALVAEYCAGGTACAPVFRFLPRGDGTNSIDYHILVMIDGRFEDPSKKKGMGKDEVQLIPWFMQSDKMRRGER